MSDNIFKEIHIGRLLKKRVDESNISESRICNFLSLPPDQINAMYQQTSIDSIYLLMWSKLLEYDFFRIYSQHLILYAPASTILQTQTSAGTFSRMPQFRKNLYTKEVVEFMLELIETKKKNIKEITLEYGIPSTTLNTWIKKYHNPEINADHSK